MKKRNVIFTAMFLLLSVFSLQAQDNKGEFFIGKWKLLVEGTPAGDSNMIIEFIRGEDGQITGTNSDETGETPIIKFDRVDVEDESITAYWVAQGYDVYIFLEKVGENEVEGSLMDMFDATGERMKDEE